MKKDINSAPIFIIGAQRSGTTLLRLLLNGHSKIAIPEEGDFFMPILRKVKSNVSKTFSRRDLENYIKFIRNNSQFKLWALNADDYFDKLRVAENITFGKMMSGLYSHLAKSQDKQIWGDKTPSFFRVVSILNNVFPNGRFIHIIRDGRDLYLSWRKIDPTKKNISLVAMEWNYKVKKIRSALSAIDDSRFIEIRYEDLVNGSVNKMQEICKFLALDYEPSMMNFWQNSNEFIGEHHSELIFHPVSSASTNKWKKELSERENRKFETIAGSLLEANGYELSQGDSKNFSTYINVIFEMFYGLPYRAIQVLMTRLNYYLSARLGFKLYSAEVGEMPVKSRSNNLE